MLTDRLHPQVFEVVDSGDQSDLLRDVHGPRLELVRRILVRRTVRIDLHDHLAAAQERVHALEVLELPIEPTRSGRPEHLVARDGQEIDVQPGHVDRVVRHQLSSIDHDHPANGVDRVGQLPERRKRADHVRLAGDGDDLGPVGDQPVQIAQVQETVIAER